jgi:biopolymer transport protein ExbD
MSVVVPGRRPAFEPIGRLRSSPLSGGKKSIFVSLNLTAMVDMFTILVIFLIQLFTSAGDVTLDKNVKVPRSEAGELLEEPGTIVLFRGKDEAPGQFDLLLVDGQPISPDSFGDALTDAAGGSIPGVVKVLTEQREFREKIEGRDATQSYQGVLLVQADVKTDFRLVRRVLASANEAGWAKIKFVTLPVKSKDAPKAEGAAAEG